MNDESATYADELAPILALIDAAIKAKSKNQALDFLEELGQELDDRVDALHAVGM